MNKEKMGKVLDAPKMLTGHYWIADAEKALLSEAIQILQDATEQPVQPTNLSAELAAALTEVMVWIDNWSPSFTEDAEWAEAANSARTALKNAIAQTVQPVSNDEIEAAVLAERAACAILCEARYMGDNTREDMEARRCAAMIRACTI